MTRRTWIMGMATAVLAPFAAAAAQTPPPQTPTPQAFANPPAADRPEALYFWMNGNVTAKGLDADFTAFKAAGLGGVVTYDGSSDVPHGPVDYLSPQWLGLMTHMMADGKARDMKVGMVNAPGWSSSGGPWITPDLAMQQFTWTETRVGGGRRVKVRLPRPYTKLGFYKDAAVIAYPSSDGDEDAYRGQVAAMTVDGRPVDSAVLTDRDLATSVEVGPNSPLIIRMKAPFSARAVTLYARKEAPAFTGVVEASDDGLTWKPVAKVAAGGERGIEAPGSANFDAVTATCFRITPSVKTSLAEALVYATPRLPDWDIKSEANFRMGAGLPAAAKGAGAQYAIDPAQVIDLTDKVDAQGNLTWTAPKGQWTVLRLGHTPTGKLNVSASDSGRGLEVDKLSAAALDFEYDHSVGRMVKAAGGMAADTFDKIEIDSYEAGLQNWTENLPADFKARNGYAMTAYLPALTGRVVGDEETSNRFLFDYRRTLADLMADNYYGRMQTRVLNDGLHFLVEGYGPGPFDELQISGRTETPMTEFWTRTPWTDNRSVKMVSSAAHTYGKTEVAAESFTGEAETSRWEDYPYAMKPLGDLMFTLGVNQMLFHRAAHQPDPGVFAGMTMGPWGINFDSSNTWVARAKPWTDYLSRSGYMLKQGLYAADILVFVGEQSPNQAELVRPDVNPDSNPLLAQYVTPRIPAGYAYDEVNAEVLLTRARVAGGRIVLPNGAAYALLVIPDKMTYMTPQLAAKLRDLVAQGAHILGPKPVYSPSLTGSDARFRADVDAIWSSPTVTSGQPIETVMAGLGLGPDADCHTASPDGQVAWLHRKLEMGELYFVANRQRRSEDVTCDFRVSGSVPQLWDPETGAVTQPAVWGEERGRTKVVLHLTPAGSTFVVFKAAAGTAPSLKWVARDGRRVADIDAPPRLAAAAPSDSFTLSVWANPDIDLRLMPQEAMHGRVNETGKFYVIPARSGLDMHGAGTAVAGLAVGRNGAYVIERVSPDEAPAALVSHTPVAGWTHFALVYDHGMPSLYINGKLDRTGLKSGWTVFAGGSDAPAPNGVTYFFEGEAGPVTTTARALSADEIAAIAAKGPPAPDLSVPPAELSVADGALRARAWQSGTYTSDRGALFTAAVAAPTMVEGPWHVSFEKGRGAPAGIDLPKLDSLSHNADPGVKYFSGTATYSRAIVVPAAALKPGGHVYLDLGRVEVMAEVRVNGRGLGELWKAPYRAEITGAVHAGVNRIEVAVTDLWPNRMIGDAQKPEIYKYVPADWAVGEVTGADGKAVPVMAQKVTELPDWYKAGRPKPDNDGKTTFQTWKFFGKDEPLFDSGLLGPVRLVYARDYQVRLKSAG